MILREIAIYLWGDWGKDGSCLLSSRCVCTLIERLLDKKVRTEESWKASLLWTPSITDARILTLGGVTEKQVVYDYEAYLEGSDKEKMEFILKMIREGIGDIFLHEGWDYTALMEACDEAERLGLHNQWIAKKPKNNKSRSVTAEIEVVHEIDTFTINVVFRNKKTGEEERIMLYETDQPDDFICYDYLGKFIWTNNEEIELHHKWTGKVMRVKCSIV